MTRDTWQRLMLATLVLAVLLLIALNVHGEERITLRVSPLITLAPRIIVTATWRVQRNKDNRLTTLQWESDEAESGSTSIQLDETSPTLFQRRVELSTGEYVFLACVYPHKACSRVLVSVGTGGINDHI